MHGGEGAFFDEFHCADEFTYAGGNAWGCPDTVLFENLNKYIVFDIDSEENQDVIIDNKYPIPYAISKLAEITFIIKMLFIFRVLNIPLYISWNKFNRLQTFF